ncbi:MAG TPA: O-antigen ligase family protein [Noviherbaspirillum sp.]|nr:O-antigen ligase family protein [Noviherbaspirillum sp.]
MQAIQNNAALSRGHPSEGTPGILIVVAVTVAILAGALSALFGGLVALIFFAVVSFMLFAISDYRAGILIAMVLLPLSASRLVPREMLGITGLNPLNVTLAMAGLSVAFMWLFQRHRMAVPRIPRPFLLYGAVIAFAAAYGTTQVGMIPPFFRTLEIINFDSAGGYLRDVFLKPMLMLGTAFLLAILVRNAKRPQRFLLPFFLSAMVLPLFVIGYIASSGVSLGALASQQARDVLSITGMHANELGLMFNMSFALALFTVLGARGLTRWALIATCAVLVVAVLLTFSRGAFLGLLTVAGIFLITQRRFKILFAGMLLLPLSILLLPDAVIERATTGLENRSIAAITAGRVDDIWRPILPEISKSPVIGHGLHSMLWLEPVAAGATLKVGHPHNAYLATLLDVGVGGALIVGWFFWRMRRQFAEQRARLADPLWQNFFRGATACILLLLIQGITDDRFTPTFPQTYLWLAYGMAIGLAGRLQEPDSQERTK